MDVPKGHVWNQEADGDKVPDIGRYGHGGHQWRFGGGVWINPSDELFGAHQMTTGEDSWNGEKTAGSEGHSEYWEPGTSSLRNQAQVVAGKYGSVHLKDQANHELDRSPRGFCRPRHSYGMRNDQERRKVRWSP